ncbi:MAG: hypothetical protein ACREMQ_10670, partial [Longimicrobiales bacterium]
MNRAALILCLLPAVAATLDGQDSGGRPSAAECAEAIDALRSRPPAEPGTDPWWTATGCGTAGGQALAQAVAGVSSETDSARLNRAENVLAAIQDAAVFSALLTLAADASASPRARIFAFTTLVRIDIPHVYVADRSNFQLTGPAPCRMRTMAVAATKEGAALPTDFREQA